jgi:hypothetical protein
MQAADKFRGTARFSLAVPFLLAKLFILETSSPKFA